MKKISLYIDEQLWHRFRIECVKRKTSASQEVAGLMEQQLHQWQLEDEQRAAPSGGGGANPLAVHREAPRHDGPLDGSRPARLPHTAEPRQR
jgi:hypothetical protein